MPSTFVHGLLPASCVLASYRALPPFKSKDFLKLLLFAAVMGNSPDLDLIPAFLFPSHFFFFHRDFGHNVFVVTLWILLGRSILKRLLPNKLSPLQAWSLSALPVLSHLVFDIMGAHPGTGAPTFIHILWPINSFELSSRLQIFESVIIRKDIHPILAYSTSADFWSGVFQREMLHSLSILFIWYIGFNSLYWILKIGPRFRSPEPTQVLPEGKETPQVSI